MGKPSAGHCGCPSAEQIVQTVHSPSPILSPVHCLCPCISFWLGKIALRASEQTVQKRASYLLPFPGELAFLFRLQAVKGLESLCQDPELIALSLKANAGAFFIITKCLVNFFLPNYAVTPPASPFFFLFFFWELPNIWYWIHTGLVFCNTNDAFIVVVDSTMAWMVPGYSAAVKDLVERRQTENFLCGCVSFYSRTVGARAKSGNKVCQPTDASINHRCSDIWWTKL